MHTRRESDQERQDDTKIEREKGEREREREGGRPRHRHTHTEAGKERSNPRLDGHPVYK